ncbi:hypothetical protein [Pseudonocardia oroxyli]|uniref:Uncharacterized protein n=1 Tax=Pseudonocardia oroxyli TaxID=366584 RepID=A0A1G8D9I0_PSEOR|nr:hypothetical protein [Pseudonocardia oroxyli]SDH54322.1 hypothetical protein SAMN05216377_12533 [Pseudonocardia oroxyli]
MVIHQVPGNWRILDMVPPGYVSYGVAGHDVLGTEEFDIVAHHHNVCAEVTARKHRLDHSGSTARRAGRAPRKRVAGTTS